jgi:hypothetical protein
MKIRSKATLAASLMLGTMMLIAVSIGWANAQVPSGARASRSSTRSTTCAW